MFDMNIIAWLIVGVVAGALAKLILPGKQGGGFWMTMLLGVVGALLAGFIGGLIFPNTEMGFWNPLTWIFAVAGSIVVLLIWGFITKGRNKNKRTE